MSVSVNHRINWVTPDESPEIIERLTTAANQLEVNCAADLAEYTRSLIERIQSFDSRQVAWGTFFPDLYRPLSAPEATIAGRLWYALDQVEQEIESSLGERRDGLVRLYDEAKKTIEADVSSRPPTVRSEAYSILDEIRTMMNRQGHDTYDQAALDLRRDWFVCAFITGQTTGFFLGMKALTILQSKPELLGVETSEVATVVARLAMDEDYRREFVALMADQIPAPQSVGEDEPDFRQYLMCQ